MNWLIFWLFITGTEEKSEFKPKPSEIPTEPAAEKQPEPNIELLMFLAEWEDSDNDQWIDPEVFASENTMNLQLDKQKATKNETDPDHN